MSAPSVPAPIRVSDIYVTSGFPEYTFVPPGVYSRLVNALGQRTGGVVVEGPSGIGKTVAVTRAVSELGDALGRVTTLSSRNANDVSEVRHVAADKPGGTWIVEDFHHLPEPDRAALADAIKYLADQSEPSCKLVLIGINNAGQSLLVGSSDLLTRITVVEFERNPDERVEELVSLGEQWLNVRIPNHDLVLTEARGSFLLAQLICRAACDAADLTVEHSGREPLPLNIDLQAVIGDVLDDLGRQFEDVCRKFARGKKPKRAGRAPYLQCLRWLAEGNEWSIQLERAAELNPRYKGSVTQILKKSFLAQHINDDPEIAKLIHLSDENYLSVEDPRFVFFLRHVDWAKYREQIGFGPESQHNYDFALSFAGPQRELARLLYESLTESGFSVFFDEGERDQMLGEDLRAYLAPIYASGAEFVLVVLGPEYPKRYWTAFEEDQYSGRIADGSVIPIWTPDAAPTFASELTDKGALVFSSMPPTPAELAKAVDDLGAALEKRVAKTTSS
ncbi:MAG TPA: TIR domain-containing protein [Solirubrobacteraceae bacterium]|nr:TIR domain-containing protein [Solirubrobacteraceae bacterium]